MIPAESGPGPRAPLGTVAVAILAEFADSFPASAHYRGGRKLRKAGWERVFARVATDVEAKESFLDAVDELAAAGLVSVKWKRFREGSEVDALYLEDPTRMYELLGRRSPEAVRREMLAVLDSPGWAGTDATLDAVRTWLRSELEARHPTALSDAASLRDLPVLLRLTPDEARRDPIRALSVRLYSDSKRLEALLPAADRVTAAATGAPVSGVLGLARSYPDSSLALVGTLVLRGEPAARWRLAGEAVTLPASTVDAIEAVELAAGGEPAGGVVAEGAATPSPNGGAAVVSVENKETFHALAARLRDGSLPVWIRGLAYCGGHPHRSYVRLLARCAAGGADLYHFGDLDPDGLLIFAELGRALAGPLRPFAMDLRTYLRYLDYAYVPPTSRLEQLSSQIDVLPPALRPLAAEIVARGAGVEQEVITVDSSVLPTR